MGTEIETEMSTHSIKEYWGGDDKGVMVQVTANYPLPVDFDSSQHENFIQLDLIEASKLCKSLNDFIVGECKRRQGLLEDQLKNLRFDNQTVFHEVLSLDESLFKVSNISVDLIDKLCPKTRG